MTTRKVEKSQLLKASIFSMSMKQRTTSSVHTEVDRTVTFYQIIWKTPKCHFWAGGLCEEFEGKRQRQDAGVGVAISDI